MSLNRKQLAVIHLAAKEMGASDDEYRMVLFNVAGVRSAKELDGASFRKVMDYFRSLGWQGREGGRSFGHRPGMATPAEVDFIRSLWGEYTGRRVDDRELGRWLERTFKVSAVRFLSADQAPKAIAALRAMAARSRDAREQRKEGGGSERVASP